MGRILRPILMVFALAGLGLTAMPLRAQTVVKSPNVTAQLMAEHASVRPGGTLWVALKFKIRPGWHTAPREPLWDPRTRHLSNAVLLFFLIILKRFWGPFWKLSDLF